MAEEQVVDSGTGGGDSGGGEGHVSESFNVAEAVESIGSDLGFKSATAAKPEPETFDAATGKPVTAATPAPATPATPAPAETPEAKAAREAAAASTPPKAGDITSAPKTWKPEEAALWAQIPDAAKAAIARREEDMFRGLESYKGSAQFGNAMNQVIAPYNEILKAQGVNPVQLIGNLMRAQYRLATGTPEQQRSMIAQIAKDFNIDMGAPAQQARDAYIDPQVAQLQEKIQRLESGQTSMQQARHQELVAAKANEVNAFASDPANVHFDEVADDIVALVSANKNMTLAQAYEKAIWANPVTRAKEIARQDAEKQTKASAEAAAKAAAVKASTAANVRVQPKVGAATLPLGTMEDTMQETLRAINSRK